MARKKWEAKSELTPALIKVREKRKWQISFRRYVLERQSCEQYAPFFGLDILKIREWFELQFEEGVGWSDFGKKWQFDHIIPVTFFDFSNVDDLKLCWNFANIRVEPIKRNNDGAHRPDMLASKQFFATLYETSKYPLCLKMLEKIDRIERTEMPSSEKQQVFILTNRPYLDILETYSSFEFSLINTGRTVDQVKLEANFFNKFKEPD